MATIISSITAVFDAVLTWFASAFAKIVPIFYAAEGGLTFLGVLAVTGLSISVFFLLVGIVQNFLHLRG